MLDQAVVPGRFVFRYPRGTIEVHVTGEAPKQSRMVSFTGEAGRTNYVSCSKCVSNGMAALLERVYNVKVNGQFLQTPPVWRTLRGSVFEWLVTSQSYYLKPYTKQEFVNRYKGPKRAMYQRASDEYDRTGYLSKHARLSSFTKVEKLEAKHFIVQTEYMDGEEFKVPRLIQARHPIFNIVFGVFIARLEKVLLHIIDLVFNLVQDGVPTKTVFKGMNALEQGSEFFKKWSKFDNPIGIEIDQKKCDMHTVEPHLRAEHHQYKQFFGPQYHDELDMIFEDMLASPGYMNFKDGWIKYTLNQPMRRSGDMDTSLGTNYTCGGMAMQFCLENGIKKFELVMNGDDCVLIVEARDRPIINAMPHWYLGWGFRVDIGKISGVLEELSFCQTHCVFDGEHWRMTRDPRVCISKDTLTIKTVQYRTEYDRLRDAIAQCGAAIAGDLPVHKSLYKMLGRGVGKYRVLPMEQLISWGIRHLAKGMPDWADRPISDASRVSYFKAFNITPDEQREMETYLDHLTLKWNPPEKFGLIVPSPPALQL